jgi:hypothetical protein
MAGFQRIPGDDDMLTEQCRADFYAVQYAGTWLVAKSRRQALHCGTQHAARLLRKQGCPLHLALRILGGVR